MVRSLHLMLFAAGSSAMLDQPLEQTSLLQVNRDVAGAKCSSGKCTPGEELPEPEPLPLKGSCSEKKCKDGFEKRKNAGKKECKDVKCTLKECCRKSPIIVLPTVLPTTEKPDPVTEPARGSCNEKKCKIGFVKRKSAGKKECKDVKCTAKECCRKLPITTKKPDVELECDDPKCDLEELCKNTVTLSTSEQSLISNNLGGRGPGITEGNDIRYASLINGKDIDLVVTVRGDDKQHYMNADQQVALREKSLSRNGARGDFGTISIADKEEHKFRFEFQNSKTREPVKLASVMFTFFDLDGKVPGAERISSCDAKYAVTATGSTLSKKTNNGCKTFSSSVRGIPNVEDSTKMTVDQKKGSVVMAFEDKSGFDLDFSITKGTRRNFLFSAHPTFVCPGIKGNAGFANKGGKKNKEGKGGKKQKNKEGKGGKKQKNKGGKKQKDKAGKKQKDKVGKKQKNKGGNGKNRKSGKNRKE